MATTIRRRMLATGARMALAPVLDISRDPRWGRVEETYGEDPYLAAVLGCAYVRGLQGTDLADGVAATAQALRRPRPRRGRPEPGAGPRRPARAARRAAAPVRGRGPRRRPRERHARLLRRRRRAVPRLARAADDDPPRRVGLRRHRRLRLHRGPDARHRAPPDAGPGDGGGDGAPGRRGQRAADDRRPTATPLARGDRGRPGRRRAGRPRGRADAPAEVPARPVRATVRRPADARRPGDARRRRARAGRATWPGGRSSSSRTTGRCRSRATAGRVAVIGPIADSARDLLGDYAHLLHMETLARCATANPFGFPSNDVIDPVDELAGRRRSSTRSATRFGAERVVHARGTGLRDGDDDELAEAVAAARDADVAIVVARRAVRADRRRDRPASSATGATSGSWAASRSCSRRSSRPARRSCSSSSAAGRSRIEWAAEHCAAVLLAWVPGDAGPDAIADVLAGDVDPGGKLPVSVPRHVGQVPLTYRHHPTGGQSNPKGDYVDGPTTPLWPFGYGRSYTTFAIDHLRVDRSILETAGDVVTIRVDVTNTGDAGRRRGRPALRPRRGGVGRPPGPRAARVPAAAPRGGRVPDRRLPAVDRAARLRRRRLPARRRARHDPDPRRPVVGGPAADRRARARRPDRRAGRSARLPDGDERRIGRARAGPALAR